MVKKARYEVARDLGKVEIRRYPALVVARVEGMGEDGFNPLFRYIQGNNRRRSKVAMTAPVISEGSQRIEMTAPVMMEGSKRVGDHVPVLREGGSMSFVMPDDLTMETTPEPFDERVRIEEVPDRTLAVLRFSGRWTERSFTRRSEELLEELRRAGIGTRGETFAMVYNPPFTPPFLRRNEVAVEIAP